MLRSTLIVSALSLLNSVLSFVNQLVLARLFGTGKDMDAYLVAISIPSTVTALLVGSMGYQLVPALQRAKSAYQYDDPTLQSLVRGIGGTTILLSLFCAFNAQNLILIFGANLTELQEHLAIRIAVISWLCLPLAVVSSIYTAGLHVRLKFFAATAMGSIPIIGSLISCLTMHSRLGVSSIIWGQFISYFLMICGLRMAIGGLKQERDWRGLREVVSSLPWALLALMIFVIYPFSDAVWGANVGPAAVSYLGYAQRLLVGFSGLAVVGATTVLFPRFAKHAATGDKSSLTSDVGLALRTMLALMAPSAAILGALALPIIELLFVRGAFSIHDAENLAAVFRVMLIGMVAMSAMGLAFKALFAQGHIKSAGLLSLSGAAIYFILSAFFSTSDGLRGIGFAYSVTWWVIFAFTVRVLGLGIFSLARFIFCTIILSAVGWFTAYGLFYHLALAEVVCGGGGRVLMAATGSVLACVLACLFLPGLSGSTSLVRRILEAREQAVR